MTKISLPLFLPLLLPALLGIAEPARAETIIIGVRTDAKPFAWRDAQGQFHGFLWHICLEAATRAKYQVQTTPLTAEQRGAFMKSGEWGEDVERAPDILCDPVTLNLDRLSRMTEWDPAYRPSPILFLADSSYVLQAENQAAHPPDARTFLNPDNPSIPCPAESGKTEEAKEKGASRQTWWSAIDSWIRIIPASPKPREETSKGQTEYWGAVDRTTSSAPGQLANALKDAATMKKPACGVLYPNHATAARDFCDGVLTRYYGDVELVKAAIGDEAARRGEACKAELAPRDAESAAYEPYVLLTSSQQAKLTDRINRALYGMFADGEIERRFAADFSGAKPSDAVKWLMRINKIAHGATTEQAAANGAEAPERRSENAMSSAH